MICRLAGALVKFCPLQLLLGYRAGEQAPPTAGHRQQRPHANQPVVLALQMRPRAGPAVLARRVHQPVAHGVEFDVPGRRQQIKLVHHERGEPALPKMPPPPFTEVDPPRVPAVRLADRQAKGVLRPRHGDQMHVVGHQAIRPNLDAPLAAPLAHQFQVGRVIVVAEERLLPPVATLGNVVRHARNNHSR